MNKIRNKVGENLKLFILVENTRWGKESYKGKTYIVHGECYPVVATGSDLYKDAKKYTSRKISENACKKLNEKVGRSFEVEEIED